VACSDEEPNNQVFIAVLAIMMDQAQVPESIYLEIRKVLFYKANLFWVHC